MQRTQRINPNEQKHTQKTQTNNQQPMARQKEKYILSTYPEILPLTNDRFTDDNVRSDFNSTVNQNRFTINLHHVINSLLKTIINQTSPHCDSTKLLETMEWVTCKFDGAPNRCKKFFNQANIEKSMPVPPTAIACNPVAH